MRSMATPSTGLLASILTRQKIEISSQGKGQVSVRRHLRETMAPMPVHQADALGPLHFDSVLPLEVHLLHFASGVYPASETRVCGSV